MWGMLIAVLQTHAIADHNVCIVLACHKHQNDQTSLRGIRSMIRNESERNGEKNRKEKSFLDGSMTAGGVSFTPALRFQMTLDLLKGL